MVEDKEEATLLINEVIKELEDDHELWATDDLDTYVPLDFSREIDYLREVLEYIEAS